MICSFGFCLRQNPSRLPFEPFVSAFWLAGTSGLFPMSSVYETGGNCLVGLASCFDVTIASLRGLVTNYENNRTEISLFPADWLKKRETNP